MTLRDHADLLYFGVVALEYSDHLVAHRKHHLRVLGRPSHFLPALFILHLHVGVSTGNYECLRDLVLDLIEMGARSTIGKGSPQYLAGSLHVHSNYLINLLLQHKMLYGPHLPFHGLLVIWTKCV